MEYCLQTPQRKDDCVCEMCPVRPGSPKLLPCCLCDNCCHIGCSYQTHLGRVCPCHIRVLDPKRKIFGPVSRGESAGRLKGVSG